MDFDPSAFLSVAMTEDQDTVYTAPDVPQGFSPIKIPEGKITVEGGLQMEQAMQIPVPVFGLLEQEQPMEEENGEINENGAAQFETPIHIDTVEPESSTTPQASPGERTISPSTKKIIHATHEETRFRKELFCGHYERVKIFRLHCSICDRHLGCAPWINERQMRMHKLLSVIVCRQCFEFYGDINFPSEEGSELFCCWCGEGGQCFCCSTCPRIVCKKCVERNFSADKVKEIDKNDDWSCFVCKPEDIWPHRALMWGLQRWSKGTRQLVSMLTKEEKQAKLSMDTSQCCLKANEEFTAVGLPYKAVLSKIPLNLIALPYLTAVKEVILRQDANTNTSNGLYSANNHLNHGNLPMNRLSPMVTESVPRVPGTFQQIGPRGVVGYHVRQQVHQVVHRNMVVANRPAPYPMNRNTPPILRPPAPPPPQPPLFPPRIATYNYRMLPQNRMAMNPSHHSHDVIDLEKDSTPHQNVQQPPLMDISPLENGVRDVKAVLQPTLMMLKQFDIVKNELSNDFAKLTSYSERLSYNIKIAICNLAKVNTELIESRNKIIDNRVSTVISSIQLTIDNNIQTAVENVRNSNPVNGTLNPTKHNSLAKTPEPKTSSSNKPPATPSSSVGEDVEDVTIAVLCETVLEVEENKENKSRVNKDQTACVKESPQVNNKAVKGKHNSKTNILKRKPAQSVSPEIQVIDLIDEEEEEEKVKFDESLWCKKFKIVPCKVVLERLEILKVEVV